MPVIGWCSCDWQQTHTMPCPLSDHSKFCFLGSQIWTAVAFFFEGILTFTIRVNIFLLCHSWMNLLQIFCTVFRIITKNMKTHFPNLGKRQIIETEEQLLTLWRSFLSEFLSNVVVIYKRDLENDVEVMLRWLRGRCGRVNKDEIENCRSLPSGLWEGFCVLIGIHNSRPRSGFPFLHTDLSHEV